MAALHNFHGDEVKASHDMMAIMEDVRLVRGLAYINGKWTSGDSFHPVHNPADGSIIGYTTRLSQQQLYQTIDDAERAFRQWRKMQAEQRAEVLMRWHDLILQSKQDLARLMVMEQGKTIGDALGEIDYGASFIRWFAEEARRSYGETIPSHIPNAQLSTIREPIGVAALITPWNFLMRW